MAEYSFDKLSVAIDLITQGGQRPVIDTIISPFSAEGIEEAYKKLKSRRTKGKIIVRVCEDEGGDEKKRYE
jgi:NADPH:quinone reductase-like Zn-dependent oxidoreductase